MHGAGPSLRKFSGSYRPKRGVVGAKEPSTLIRIQNHAKNLTSGWHFQEEQQNGGRVRTKAVFSLSFSWGTQTFLKKTFPERWQDFFKPTAALPVSGWRSRAASMTVNTMKWYYKNPVICVIREAYTFNCYLLWSFWCCTGYSQECHENDESENDSWCNYA